MPVSDEGPYLGSGIAMKAEDALRVLYKEPLKRMRESAKPLVAVGKHASTKVRNVKHHPKPSWVTPPGRGE